MCVQYIYCTDCTIYTKESPLLRWLDIADQSLNEFLAWPAYSLTNSCLRGILVVLYKYNNVFLCALYVPYGCKFPGHVRFKMRHVFINLRSFKSTLRPKFCSSFYYLLFNTNSYYQNAVRKLNFSFSY